MSPYTSDEFAQVRGFKIEIDGAGGKEVDTAWESVSGGELFVELSPGPKSVGEITLRGVMTSERTTLASWINATVAGKGAVRNVSITPLDLQGTPGPTYTFYDCVLTRYSPPTLKLGDLSKIPLREEVRFTYRDWTRLG